MTRFSWGRMLLGFVLILAAARVCAAPVFPGAQGFGTQTPAGRGGKILRVTNLDPSGPGSLREALEAKGPRIVVFEVGGVIDLNRKALTVKEPFLTIAGQTAPAPGITLVRGGMSIQTHDVLMQHISIRPGDAGRPKKSGWSPDGLSTYKGDAYNIVIDHCSFTWAVDENLSASGERGKGPKYTTHDATFSNCIIANSLNNSSHEKGPHGKGTLIHDHVQNMAIIGNLYANNADRNPLFKGGTLGVMVNNFIYNPGGASIRVAYVPSEYKGKPVKPEDGRIAVVGNVMRHGKDTKQGLPLVSGRGNGQIYLEDNIALDREGKPVPMTDKSYKILNDKPAWPEGLKPLPASAVEESVLKHAGARPAERDPIDRAIVEAVLERKGGIIDSQEQSGGYPKPEPKRRELQIPQDVDRWLAEMAKQVE